MTEEFKPGDLVQLNSGGPIMTVQAVADHIVCVWFQGAKQQDGIFSPAVLKHYKPPRPMAFTF